MKDLSFMSNRLSRFRVPRNSSLIASRVDLEVLAGQGSTLDVLRGTVVYHECGTVHEHRWLPINVFVA